MRAGKRVRVFFRPQETLTVVVRAVNAELLSQQFPEPVIRLDREHTPLPPMGVNQEGRPLVTLCKRLRLELRLCVGGNDRTRSEARRHHPVLEPRHEGGLSRSSTGDGRISEHINVEPQLLLPLLRFYVMREGLQFIPLPRSRACLIVKRRIRLPPRVGEEDELLQVIRYLRIPQLRHEGLLLLRGIFLRHFLKILKIKN